MELRELLPDEIAWAIRRSFGIKTVEELREIPLSRLLNGRGIGPKKVEVIKKALGYTDERSLYQCFHAKVIGEKVHCAKGHKLPSNAGAFSTYWALAHGAPLIMSCCQNCNDYDEMGPPIPANERGWLNLAPEKG